MKAFPPILMAFLLLILLCGCGTAAQTPPAAPAPPPAAVPDPQPTDSSTTVICRLGGDFMVTVTVQDSHYARNSGEDPAFSADLTLKYLGLKSQETIYYGGFQWASCTVVDADGQPVSGLTMSTPSILSNCTVEKPVPARIRWTPSGEPLDAAGSGACFLRVEVSFFANTSDKEQQNYDGILLLPLTIE